MVSSARRHFWSFYQIYKRYVIQYKIMDLVPSRPELEFPETMAMNRRFILHIGPTNSGKTFHALERLKNSEKGHLPRSAAPSGA